MSDDDEIRRLRAEVEDLRQAVEVWRRQAEEQRAKLERLRSLPLVAQAADAVRFAAPWLRRARRTLARARTARAAVRRLREIVEGTVRAPARRRALRASLARRAPVAPQDGLRVAVLVLTRDGGERLTALVDRLVDGLGGQARVVVVDNASEPPVAPRLPDRAEVEVRRLDRHRSFAAAYNDAVADLEEPFVCLLNDDVVPVTGDWLARLLDAVEPDVAAVGAQLAYAPGGGVSRRPPYVVQHDGIWFDPRPGATPRAANHGGGPVDATRDPYDVPAATAACLLVRTAALRAVGGLDERYEFGAEDVDLCLRLRAAGWRVRMAPGAVLLHAEGATRRRVPEERRRARQAENWRRFDAVHGPELARAVDTERLLGRPELSRTPYRVAITVTRADEAAGYGDWGVAKGLGDALDDLGWSIRYVERRADAWYEGLGDVDAVLVLLDSFDLRRLPRPAPTTIAWVRNWTTRWTHHPWFDQYDVVLAASPAIAERIRRDTGRRAHVFPPAVDPGRFRPTEGPRSGVVTAANRHGHDRGLPALLAALPELELHGHGWEGLVPDSRWRGPLDRDGVAALYGRAAVVVDVSGPHTRNEATPNSRVLEALAAGAMVVSDQPGARDLLGPELPVFERPDELVDIVRRLVDAPGETAARVRALRGRVLAEHGWRRRAATLRDVLVRHRTRPGVAFLIGAPTWSVAASWGDRHLAEGLAARLRADGHESRVLTQDDWRGPARARADVVVHLRGRGRVDRADGQLHLLWLISHPDEVTPDELADADAVLVASRPFAARLRDRLEQPVVEFLQATDPGRFRPMEPDPAWTARLAFVGNSRHRYRPIVRHAVEAGLEPMIVGANWRRFVDPRLIRAEHVPNDRLARLYCSVDILLNDHWEDMRREGFLSNRLFDALACGTCVVSDDAVSLHEVFGGAVLTVHGPQDLAATVARLQASPEERRRRGREGREIVLAEHSFEQRARTLRALIDDLAAGDGPTARHVAPAP